MATRFEAYRMRDGVTPLSADYFNQVHQDIDTRIVDLEQKRDYLQQVADQLTSFGLARIDTLVIPVMGEVNAMLAQLRQRRDELEESIRNVGELATLAQLADAIEGVTQTLTEALQAEQEARGEAIAHATALPSAAAYTYDGAGRISTIVETINGQPSTQTLSYNPDGTVHTITTVFGGITRVEAYDYAAGHISGMTATEEAP